MNIWNPPFRTVDREFYEAMEETFDSWWDRAEESAGDRLDFVRRSRLQWRTIKLMLRPDKEKAADLLSEFEKREIRWRESRTLPEAPDLYASPETWR